MAFYAGLAWLPEILQSQAWSAEAAGSLQALLNLVSIVPAFAVPVLASRLRAQVGVALVVVAAGAVGALGLLVAPGAAPAWVVLLGLGQGGTLGLALILPVLRAGTPGSVASLTAMMLSIGYLVAAAGPWLVGVARDLSGGWTAPLVVLLVITVLELVPGVPAARARRVHEAAPGGSDAAAA
jgi:CP family cyanate transporter-like MFS transporter